ncbi:MAG: hypothetical protein JSR59_09545 [Proteobacteria bacterium]|nr:hypothetical protein [Pseudomonadota bacterium]
MVSLSASSKIYGFVNPFQLPMAVARQLQLSLIELLLGFSRQQRLSSDCDPHHPRRDRFGQPIDIQRFRPRCHVLRRGFAQRHLADMNPGPRQQRRIDLPERPVIGLRIADGVGGAVEQQHEPVALVDFAPAPLAQQVARKPVVLLPHLRHRGIAELLGDARAVDDVGHQQGQSLDLAHARSL